MEILEMLGYGSLVAIALGVVLPILATYLLHRFTRIDDVAICACTNAFEFAILAPATLGLSGLALWLGPTAIIVFVLGVNAFGFAVMATWCVTWLPRRGTATART